MPPPLAGQGEPHPRSRIGTLAFIAIHGAVGCFDQLAARKWNVAEHPADEHTSIRVIVDDENMPPVCHAVNFSKRRARRPRA